MRRAVVATEQKPRTLLSGKRASIALIASGAILVVVALILLYLGLTPPSDPASEHPSQRQSIELEAVHDTFAWHSQPDTSFGTWETFFTWDGSHAFVGFSTQHIPRGTRVVSATLRLVPHDDSTAGGEVAVAELLQPEAHWDETSVTWTAQPSVDPSAGRSVTVLSEPTSGVRDIWDVTQLVRHALTRLPPPQLSAGPTEWPTIGFRLRLTGSVAARQEWWTKDSGQGDPRLTLFFEDLETCCASVHVEPAEAQEAGCTAAADPTEGWCGVPVALNARGAPGWIVQEVEGPGTLQYSSPECTDLAVRFGRAANVVCGVDPRVHPLDAAGAVSSSPSTCPCGEGQVELQASPQEGWMLDHWDGYAAACGESPTCTVACPDGGVEAAVAAFAPLLRVDGDDIGVTCPPEDSMDHPILTLTLCASQADDWRVGAVGVRTTRSGESWTGTDQLRLKLGGSQLDDPKSVDPSKGLVRFRPSDLTVPAGECVDLSMQYRFDRADSQESFPRSVMRYAVEVDPGFIDARPVRYAPGRILGGASGHVDVGPVINHHSSRAFDTIQVAVDDPLTKDLQTITICPGEHTENVRVSKSLTLHSAAAGVETVLQAAKVGQPVLETEEEMTVIEGLTIRGARRAWGVWARRGVTLRDCRVTDNEGGIHTRDGSFAGDRLVVDHNDGPGIAASTLDDVVLRDVHVLDNAEDGLRLAVGSGGGGLAGGLLLRGTDNRIANNGGDGIRATSGRVSLEGSTEIRGNGGWGIRADEGAITVADGGTYSVTANGRGGLFAAQGMELPPGFSVDDNGGPGIVVWSVGDTRLESVSVRGNRGVGIGFVTTGDAPETVDRGLILEGEGNQIVDNAGDGIAAASGSVVIRGDTEISGNAGWGIIADEGSVTVADPAMDALRGNGQGGVFAGRGLVLPSGFVVENNGGPGIVVRGDQNTKLRDVSVQGNLGVGIAIGGGSPWEHERLPTLILHGTDNRIVNNLGDGIRASPGSVAIRGGTQLRDNGGWGIYAVRGPVTVSSGALEGITGNGRGGIYASGGLELPEGFLLVGNGGPGIRVRNGDHQLTNVRIRKNAGPGIDLERGRLILQGTDNAVRDNGGDGIRAYGSALSVRQADISKNDGWGIRAYGAGPLAASDTTVRRNGLGGVLTSELHVRGHRLTVDLNGGHGLMVSRGSLSVRDAQINGNEGYGVYAADVQPDLADLVVSDNADGGMAFEAWHRDWAEVWPEQGAPQAWDSPLPWPPAADSRQPVIRNCRIAENGNDGVTLRGGLASLALEESDILENAGHALVNADGDVPVSAPRNWWGQTGDPRDQIRGSVDCEPWATSARSLTVVPEDDPTYVQRGVSDSAVIRILDWAGLARTVVLTVSDTHDWLTGPRATTVSLDEDGETLSLLSVRFPPDVPLGTTNPVTVRIAPDDGSSAARRRVFDLIAGPVADLTVHARHEPPEPLVHSALTQTVLVANRGPDEATGVVVTATLPSELESATITAGTGVCGREKDALVCRIGRIAQAEGTTVTVAMRPSSPGPVATVFHIRGTEHDPDPFDNQITRHTVVAGRVPVEAVRLDLPPEALTDRSVTLRATLDPVNATLPVTYTWRATEQWWPGRVRRRYALSDTLKAIWHAPGEQTVTVTAHNAHGPIVSQTHTITIDTLEPSIYLPLVVRGT